MFIKNDNVLLPGNELYAALNQYRVSTYVYNQLENNIRRALRTIREIANAEELSVAQATCSVSSMGDMLILDIFPTLPASARFLPNEGIKAHVRMRLHDREIVAVQETIVQFVVMG